MCRIGLRTKGAVYRLRKGCVDGVNDLFAVFILPVPAIQSRKKSSSVKKRDQRVWRMIAPSLPKASLERR